MIKSNYKTLAKSAAFIGSLIGAFGAFLGIIQYYEAKTTYTLSGEWELQLTISDSSYNPYKRMQVGYKLFLNQNGQNIFGKGEKWWVNGEELPFNQHDPIEMRGTLNNAYLPLSFELKGSKRNTVGIFNLNVVNGGKELKGTFSTTGANSSGTVKALKIEKKNT